MNFSEIKESAKAQSRKFWGHDWKEMIMGIVEHFFDRLNAAEQRVAKMEADFKAKITDLEAKLASSNAAVTQDANFEQAAIRLDSLAASVVVVEPAQDAPAP